MVDRNSFVIIERCLNGYILDFGDTGKRVYNDEFALEDVLSAVDSWLKHAVPIGAPSATPPDSGTRPPAAGLGVSAFPPAQFGSALECRNAETGQGQSRADSPESTE